ncbi:hypothetical protein [Billgrantia endophytica]|uniref:hypothetical protein n=1 Tax=Billgrantia endophytica TaxID=2033802 RepID=UPI0010544E29|nr:hypothetical protein [Halomonas endophytica]
MNNNSFKKGVFVGAIKVSMIVFALTAIFISSDYYGNKSLQEDAENRLEIQQAEFERLQQDFEYRKDKENLKSYHTYSDDLDCKIISLVEKNIEAKCQDGSAYDITMKVISWYMEKNTSSLPTNN